MGGMSSKTVYEKIHVRLGEKEGRAKSVWLQIAAGEAWVSLLPLSMGKVASHS